VAVGDGSGVGDGDGRGVGVGVGVGLGLGMGVGVGVGVGLGLGSGIGVGVGLGLCSGADVAVGVGGGDSSNGFSGFSVSSAGEGVARSPELDPGSDHPPALSPFTKFACNRVSPCRLITGPSNFPRTIFPV
jgi:hypothetical protein